MRQRVLLVDDDADFCEALLQLLEDEQFEVAQAHTHEEALSLLATAAEPLTVLVDWHLQSEAGGAELLRRAKSFPIPHRFVVMSADTAVKTSVPLLKKPFDMADCIRTICGNAKAAQEPKTESP